MRLGESKSYLMLLKLGSRYKKTAKMKKLRKYIQKKENSTGAGQSAITFLLKKKSLIS